MGYLRRIWKNRPDKTTAINAAALNNIEDGIVEAKTEAAAAQGIAAGVDAVITTGRLSVSAVAVAITDGVETAIDEAGVVTGAAEVATVAGTGWAHTDRPDAQGRVRRLPLGYTADGHVDAFARKRWLEDVHDTVTISDAVWERVEITSGGHILYGRRWDGTVVIPGLGLDALEELDRYVGPTVTEVVGPNTYLMNASTGVRTLLVAIDRARLTAVGSSTFSHMVTSGLFAGMASAHSASLTNITGSGTVAEFHFAKLGSRPLVASAGFNIPTSGTVAVSSTNVSPTVNAAWSIGGAFEGLTSYPGTLAKASGAQASWTFTPTSFPGAPVAVPSGTKFISSMGPTSRVGVMILNPGKNNLSGGVAGATNDVESVIQWTKDAFDFATATGKYVLVVGHFNDTNTATDAAARSRIDQWNCEIRAYVGERRFVDMGAYVTSSQIFTDLGLTPDAADLVQMGLGNKPPQISAYTAGTWPTGTVDPLHLTTAAEAKVFDNLIAARPTELNWY